MTALRSKFPKSLFRAAFVGYRDHTDKERFVLHGLNENVDALVAAIRSVHAHGGGDTPEDVAGGLFHALNLPWEGDVRLVLLCCDAPAHGDQYHDPNLEDAYPKGCPEGRDPAQLVRALAQKRVDMTVFRVNPSVDTMCALLKAAHKEGAEAEGGAGEDANFVLLNVEQQLAAAGAALPSVHLARCGFGLGGGGGGDFSCKAFSGDALPAVAVASGFAAPAAAPSAHAAAFSHSCMESVSRCMEAPSAKR
jgi:hypothetical protein